MNTWRNEEREQQIIELYEKYENAREVAAELGVSLKPVYTTLEKHGIPRTHRHDGDKKPKMLVSHCRSKYCPTLVVMLAKAFGWNARRIASEVGYSESGTRDILSRRGLIQQGKRTRKSDYDLDTIEYEYTVLGIPGRQLDEKYGLSEGTVCKWMRERGIRAGKGAHQEGRNGQDMIERHNRAEIEFATRLHDEFGGRFEYVGGFRANGKKFATVRCAECGTEFEHYIGFQGAEWTCPTCHERELEAQRRQRECERDGKRYELMFAEIREFTIAKTCVECGSKFQSSSSDAKYCCDACKRRVSNRRSNLRRIGNGGSFRHYYHVRYGNGYRDYYDPSVTLVALYERDGGVCQICGKPCDWNDKTWGQNGPMYPSVDHIIARANGGAHQWDNVQLAHCICNSVKRDLSNAEAMAYAKQSA